MSETTQQYRPGDVVNGHVLGQDGSWRPVPPAAPAAPAAPAKKKHRFRNFVVAPAAVIAAIAIATQAGGDDAAPVKEQGSASVVEEAPADDTAEAPADDVAQEPAEEESGTATLGDTITIGDWDVKVTEVVKNANDVIARENEFNERPKGQYVMVTYEATYHGADRTGDPSMDLTWTLTGPDQKVIDITYVVDPSDQGAGWPTTARNGGTVKDIAVFDVPAAQVDGALLSVEDWVNSEYADFAV